jgi:hypothetical protein
MGPVKYLEIYEWLDLFNLYEVKGSEGVDFLQYCIRYAEVS